MRPFDSFVSLYFVYREDLAPVLFLPFDFKTGLIELYIYSNVRKWESEPIQHLEVLIMN